MVALMKFGYLSKPKKKRNGERRKQGISAIEWASATIGPIYTNHTHIKVDHKSTTLGCVDRWVPPFGKMEKWHGYQQIYQDGVHLMDLTSRQWVNDPCTHINGWIRDWVYTNSWDRLSFSTTSSNFSFNSIFSFSIFFPFFSCWFLSYRSGGGEMDESGLYGRGWYGCRWKEGRENVGDGWLSMGWGVNALIFIFKSDVLLFQIFILHVPHVTCAHMYDACHLLIIMGHISIWPLKWGMLRGVGIESPRSRGR